MSTQAANVSESYQEEVKSHPWWIRLIIVVGIIAGGFFAMNALGSMRQEPPTVEPRETVVAADGIKVEVGDVRATCGDTGPPVRNVTRRLAPKWAAKS